MFQTLNYSTSLYHSLKDPISQSTTISFSHLPSEKPLLNQQWSRILGDTLHRPDDTMEMKFAIEHLVANGHRIARKSAYQLKVGPYNFYPTTGRITKDGGPPIQERGIEQFSDLLPKTRAQPNSSASLIEDLKMLTITEFIED
ncbi:hypothetical protein [Mesorhizobium sp. 128a]